MTTPTAPKDPSGYGTPLLQLEDRDQLDALMREGVRMPIGLRVRLASAPETTFRVLRTRRGTVLMPLGRGHALGQHEPPRQKTRETRKARKQRAQRARNWAARHAPDAPLD